MFTGIIEDIGIIKEAAPGRLAVVTALDGIKTGDSVAVAGVCLTVVSIGRSGRGMLAVFDVSPETFSRTILGMLSARDEVNLERALRADSRLGGHSVSGHVDAVGIIESRARRGNSTIIGIAAPTQYIVEKGSVAVDGVSLTVASFDEKKNIFYAAVVPHTLAKTTLKSARVGGKVNVEYDTAAKYAEKYARGAVAAKTITKEKLFDAGFR